MADVKKIAELERLCFPAAEACDETAFADRVRVYGGHFWLLEKDGQLLSLVDGLVTDEPVLTDEMYARPEKHNENGAWQMVFGVNTHPDFRHQGVASFLLERVILDAFLSGRKGLVLTCKEALLPFYENLGFVNEGLSDSSHGGAVWYAMRLTFSSIRVCMADAAGCRVFCTEHPGESIGSRENLFLARDRDGTLLGYAVCEKGREPRRLDGHGDAAVTQALLSACRTRQGRRWA